MDAMHQADRHMDEWEESLASARPPDPLVSPSPHHPFFASARSLEELREAVHLLDLIYYHTAPHTLRSIIISWPSR